jgi:molecular chaperone DnaK
MFFEEDRKKKQLSELRNQADNLLYQARKLLGEYQDKISSELKEKIESEMKELEEIKDKAQTPQELEAKIREFSEILSEIGKFFYQNPNQP